MIAEYEVNLVAEVSTTVTLVAESEEDAFNSAYDQLITAVREETAIETIEIVDYTIRKNENQIH